MSLYAKLASTYQTDERILAAGPMAELLWVRALCWSKEHMKDGEVPHAAMYLIGIGIEDCDEAAATLVRVGLWEVTDTGWRVPPDKWRAWQTTKEQVEDLRRKRSVAGAMGNAKRWGSQDDRTCDDKLSPEYRARVQSQSTEPLPPPTPPRGERKKTSAGFDAFWAQYPRRVAKADAERAWAKAIKAGATVDQVLDSLLGWCLLWSAENRDAGMVPYPATWLNRCDWREVPEAQVSPKATKERAHLDTIDRAVSAVTGDIPVSQRGLFLASSIQSEAIEA